MFEDLIRVEYKGKPGAGTRILSPGFANASMDISMACEQPLVNRTESAVTGASGCVKCRAIASRASRIPENRNRRFQSRLDLNIIYKISKVFPFQLMHQLKKQMADNSGN